MDNRNRRRRTLAEVCGPVALVALALVLARPALAVDGVIEINQARAVAGGVTTGDTAGFPVSINASGSYRLTSDLQVPTSTASGITISADDVTLDLNGFKILGPGTLGADGVFIDGHQNVEVRNGTIRGFSRNGVFVSGAPENLRLIGSTRISQGS